MCIHVFERDQMPGNNVLEGGDDYDFDRRGDEPAVLAVAIAPFMLGEKEFGLPVIAGVKGRRPASFV
jgi:hypothetical protein